LILSRARARPVSLGRIPKGRPIHARRYPEVDDGRTTVDDRPAGDPDPRRRRPREAIGRGPQGLRPGDGRAIQADRISGRYRVYSFPTVVVIDGKGIIRSLNARGGALDKLVDDLLREMESKDAAKSPAADPP
jgi:hypothetical protein